MTKTPAQDIKNTDSKTDTKGQNASTPPDPVENTTAKKLEHQQIRGEKVLATSSSEASDTPKSPTQEKAEAAVATPASPAATAQATTSTPSAASTQPVQPVQPLQPTKPTGEQIKIPSPLDPLPMDKEPPRKKKSLKGFFLIPLFVFFFLILTLGAASALIVYDVIPFNNRELKQKLTSVLLKIPFLPKTKEYVLMSMFETSETGPRSAYVDASLASSAAGLQDALGISEFDMSIKGPIDFRDEENPKTSLNIAITNEFNMDLTVLDNSLYFKVNTIPTIVKSYLGAMGNNSLDVLTSKWVYYDITPFESEARDALEEIQGTDQIESTPEIEALTKVLTEELLPEMKMVKEKLDEFDTYNLSVSLDKEQVKEITNKVIDELEKVEAEKGPTSGDMALDPLKSLNTTDRDFDILENIILNIWVDQDEYYMRKMVFTLRINAEAMSSTTPDYADPLVLGDSSSQETFDITFAVKYSDFGKDFDISAPESYIGLEEYMTSAMKALGLGSMFSNSYKNSMGAQFNMSFNGLKTAVILYWSENNQAPQSATDLADFLTIDLELVNMVYSPSKDTVLVYGLDPLAPSMTAPYLVSEITLTKDVDNYYSKVDAEVLFSDYGVVVTLPEIPENVDLFMDDSLTDEDESDTTFGKYLN